MTGHTRLGDPAEVALHLLHKHTGQEQEHVLGDDDGDFVEHVAVPWQEAGTRGLLQLGAEEQQYQHASMQPSLKMLMWAAPLTKANQKRNEKMATFSMLR